MRQPSTPWCVALGTTLALAVPAVGGAQMPVSSPSVIHVSSVALDENGALLTLIAELRSQVQAFVFLSGGASQMEPDHQRQLLAMFQGLRLVAREGRPIAVGDGGTQAGIMEAAGQARRDSGNAFPLIGVAPAGEIPPRGKTPIDPNHSHIVAVNNPSAPAQDAWGSETETMYWLFDRLAEGRPSVAIVANGGAITLSEVDANVKAGRHMILVGGSGRAADALVSIVQGTRPTEPAILELRAQAERAGLVRRKELFHVVALNAGAEGLRDAVASALSQASRR